VRGGNVILKERRKKIEVFRYLKRRGGDLLSEERKRRLRSGKSDRGASRLEERSSSEKKSVGSA